ncbi:GGDEF domain-containing protein, partial [Terrabacter sp. NPDC000476]|uniref:GGDEF domain-containing protein n=1 Tax=Terrabacter sp. NPDC000476 TaxID=3154258 RepID=UPI00331F0C14
MVYIDLDGFKAFNDSYGHSTGDRVLQVVADRLRGSCRPQDLPARLGGDEFAIIVHLPADVPAARAAEGLAQRVLACLGGTITVGQLVLPGRASIGVAVADDRLLEAAGRGGVCSAGDGAPTAA